jgi:acyl carrier protein
MREAPVPLLRRIGQALLYLWNGPRYEYELDDHTFYQRYYGNTAVPKDIPVRLRKVLVQQMGRRWLRVTPEDWLIESDEIDFVDVLDDIGDEFGLSIPDEDMKQLEPAFNSIVHYLAARIGQQKEE